MVSVVRRTGSSEASGCPRSIESVDRQCGVALFFFLILFVVDSIAHFDFFILFVPESTLLFQLCKFGSALYPISEKTTLPVLSALASFVFDNLLTSYACCRFSSFMCWFDVHSCVCLLV